MGQYINYGIELDFKKSFEVIKHHSSTTVTYFYSALEIVRFNHNQNKVNSNTQPQHLISEIIPPQSISNAKVKDSRTTSKPICSMSHSFAYHTYLSSMFILPSLSLKALKKEIPSYLARYPLYQLTEKVKEVTIGDKKVLRWRAQNGKTRLDHFVVFGPRYNYLFVSSPYGSSNGGIEKAILAMKFIKK